MKKIQARQSRKSLTDLSLSESNFTEVLLFKVKLLAPAYGVIIRTVEEEEGYVAGHSVMTVRVLQTCLQTDLLLLCSFGSQPTLPSIIFCVLITRPSGVNI